MIYRSPRRPALAAVFLGALLSFFTSASTHAAEITVWHSYRADEAAAFEKTIAAYEAVRPHSRVRVLRVPFGSYNQKLRQAIPHGVGPDIFINGHDQLGDLVARNLISPIALADSDTHRFINSTVRPLKRDAGDYWGLPLAGKSLALFYRTDMLDAPPRTLADLLRIAEEKRQGERYGLVYDAGNFYFHAPWYLGFGGRFLSDDGARITLDNPAAERSGELLRTLISKRLIPDDINGALVTEMFNTGRAAMVVNGPWFVGEIADDVPYGVAPLPELENGAAATPLLTVESLFVAEGHASAEVIALAHHLTSDAAALIRAVEGRQPVANKNAHSHSSLANDLILKGFFKQFENSLPTPTSPLTHYIWEPGAQALREIIRGALTPSAAFARAQLRAESLARPLPEKRDWRPYVVLALLGVAAALALFWRRLPRDLATRVRGHSTAYLFLAPTALGLMLLVGLPFIMGIGVGFFAFGPDSRHFVGMQNFVDILAAKDYGVSHPLSFYFTLVVTVLWTVVNVFFHVSIGFALALLLSQKWLWGRGLFRVLLILPWAIPSYITALIFKGLFNKQLGAVNKVLGYFGAAPVSWFDSFWPSFAANVTTNVWLGFPFMMVTILGILQSVPRDLYDAGKVDGAGAWQRFRHITLPMVWPALIPAVVLGTIWTFNMFNVVFLVSEGQPEGASDILVTEAYRWAFARNGRYGYAAAYSVLIFLILWLYSAITRRMLSARS